MSENNILRVTGGGSSSNVTRTTSFNIVVNKGYKSLSFSTCSDKEFVEVAQKLQSGEITTDDLSWSVGDTRDVSLGSFTSYPSGSSSTQAAQTAQLVIYHTGSAGIKFTDGTDVNYVIGFKNCVATSYYHGSNNTYSTSLLKTVENNIYNALPSTLRPAFKQFNAKTMSKGSSGILTDYPVYMCSPAEKEVFGEATYSSSTEASALTQFKWYETSNNRIKNDWWWERSPCSDNTSDSCCLLTGGVAFGDVVYFGGGVSPFGCI